MNIDNDQIGKISIFHLVEKYGTPLYVYDKQELVNNYSLIRESIPYEPKDIHFAIMSNGNPHILEEIRNLGMKIHASSPGETYLALNAGYTPAQIIITGANFTAKEFEWMVSKRLLINIDSLSQLETYANINPNSKVGIRVNPDIKAPSELKNVYTGKDARLGIPENRLSLAKNIAQKYNLKIVGLQQYVGTNILDTEFFLSAVIHLIHLSYQFKDLEYVDIGGGFGVNYQNPDEVFEFGYFGKELSKQMSELTRNMEKEIILKLEPGRSIIASAGVLLGTVRDVKENDNNIMIGTDISLSNFARPYIYDAYHEIRAIGKKREVEVYKSSFVSGNTVASGDFLAKKRQLPKVKIGDILAIMDTGAYGYTMSSHFCGRLKPAEVLIDGDRIKLIRKRENFESLLSGVPQYEKTL